MYYRKRKTNTETAIGQLQFLADDLPGFVGEPVEVRLRLNHQFRPAEGFVDRRDDVSPVAEVHILERDVLVRALLDLVGHLGEVARRYAGDLVALIFVRARVDYERGVTALLGLLEDTVLLGHLVEEAGRRLEGSVTLLVLLADDSAEVDGGEDLVELASSELTVVEPVFRSSELALDGLGGRRNLCSLLGPVVGCETSHFQWSPVVSMRPPM